MIRQADEVQRSYLANCAELELVALVPPISAWLSVQDAIPCTLLVEAEVASFVLGVAQPSARLSLSRVGRSGACRSTYFSLVIAPTASVSLGAHHLARTAMLTLPLHRCG